MKTYHYRLKQSTLIVPEEGRAYLVQPPTRTREGLFHSAFIRMVTEDEKQFFMRSTPPYDPYYDEGLPEQIPLWEYLWSLDDAITPRRQETRLLFRMEVEGKARFAILTAHRRNAYSKCHFIDLKNQEELPIEAEGKIEKTIGKEAQTISLKNLLPIIGRQQGRKEAYARLFELYKQQLIEKTTKHKR